MKTRKLGNLRKKKEPIVAAAQTCVEIYDAVYHPAGTAGTVVTIAKVVLPMI